MKVQLFNFTPTQTKNTSNNSRFSNNYYNLYSSNRDIFIKNNISFKSNGTNKSGNKENTIKALAEIGFVGGTFLLGIAGATYLARKQQPEDIFLYDGTYLGKAENLSFTNDVITADANNVIFKVKGTGINIDEARFDISMPEKGIYKNYDGSVDIDLLNNKYIDTENGIFIDPNNKISAIMDNGVLKNIVVPDVSFGTRLQVYEGGRNNTSPPPYQTRAEFIEEHGVTPEEYYLDKHYYREVLPNDDRTFYKKICDYFTGDYKEKKFDIFGREIFEIRNSNGNVEYIALDENLKKIVDKYDLNQGSVNELATFFDKINLKNYLQQEYPDFSNLVLSEFKSVDEYIDSLKGNIQDVAENSNLDISDTILIKEKNLEDFWGAFLRIIDKTLND